MKRNKLIKFIIGLILVIVIIYISLNAPKEFNNDSNKIKSSEDISSDLSITNDENKDTNPNYKTKEFSNNEIDNTNNNIKSITINCITKIAAI